MNISKVLMLMIGFVDDNGPFGPKRQSPPAGKPEGFSEKSVEYQGSPWKVLQASRRPLSKPRLNQRRRCSEVPWLKLSGTT